MAWSLANEPRCQGDYSGATLQARQRCTAHSHSLIVNERYSSCCSGKQHFNQHMTICGALPCWQAT